jgi:hypothetical protein
VHAARVRASSLRIIDTFADKRPLFLIPSGKHDRVLHSGRVPVTTENWHVDPKRKRLRLSVVHFQFWQIEMAVQQLLPRPLNEFDARNARVSTSLRRENNNEIAVL